MIDGRLALLALLLAACPAPGCSAPDRSKPGLSESAGPPLEGAPHADEQAAGRAEAQRQAGAVLDALHAAASRADGGRYFALFAPGAVFLGTDATERWSIEQFRAYAEPYFARGQGWTYFATERHVVVSAGGDVAWFDERLRNDKYGEVRGSGVLVEGPDGWRIAQYNLALPVPNELAPDLVSRIRALGR
jgi:hypothetical protein